MEVEGKILGWGFVASFGGESRVCSGGNKWVGWTWLVPGCGGRLESFLDGGTGETNASLVELAGRLNEEEYLRWSLFMREVL